MEQFAISFHDILLHTLLSARRSAILENIGITCQSALLNTVQSSLAYIQHISINPTRDKQENSQLKEAPSGTQTPFAPAAVVHTSSFKLVLATQQLPEATGRFALTPARSWRRTSRRIADSRGVSIVSALAAANRARAVAKENCILTEDIGCYVGVADGRKKCYLIETIKSVRPAAE